MLLDINFKTNVTIFYLLKIIQKEKYFDKFFFCCAKLQYINLNKSRHLQVFHILHLLLLDIYTSHKVLVECSAQAYLENMFRNIYDRSLSLRKDDC